MDDLFPELNESNFAIKQVENYYLLISLEEERKPPLVICKGFPFSGSKCSEASDPHDPSRDPIFLIQINIIFFSLRDSLHLLYILLPFIDDFRLI